MLAVEQKVHILVNLGQFEDDTPLKSLKLLDLEETKIKFKKDIPFG